tara:strand:+ start:511 stop:645 length:135 start_codon:yes stop_codon:yes gene_type:complete
MNSGLFLGLIFCTVAGIMLSVYLGLCFAGWIMEVIDKTTWRWKR